MWLLATAGLGALSYALITMLDVSHVAQHDHVSVMVYSEHTLKPIDVMLTPIHGGIDLTLLFNLQAAGRVYVMVAGVDPRVGCVTGTTWSDYGVPTFDKKIPVKTFPTPVSAAAEAQRHPEFIATNVGLIKLHVNCFDAVRCRLSRRVADVSFTRRTLTVDANATQWRWLQEENWWHFDGESGPVDSPYVAPLIVHFGALTNSSTLSVSGGLPADSGGEASLDRLLTTESDYAIRLMEPDAAWRDIAVARWTDEAASGARDILLVVIGTIWGLAGAAFLEALKSLR